MKDLSVLSLNIGSLQAHFRSGSLTPSEGSREVYRRIRTLPDIPIWIHLIPEEDAMRAAEALPGSASSPVFGIPFAIKDNIDAANLPTTAGCPMFSYVAKQDATTVGHLKKAGGILIGKTNLDQFATGLVGARSPYGALSTVFHPEYISGGSSSGSAVAVAAGLVSFALGTDTAGSGRVPAAFNNIVGLKPTRGLLSTRGVVPACRSLDCVSVFALTAEDASAVFHLTACFDPEDPLARMPSAAAVRRFPSRFRLGVPPGRDLEFFGDKEAARLFMAAVGLLEQAGGIRVETSFAPFRDAGRLLYQGPWLAERLHATEALLRENPGAMLPVTRAVIERGRRYSALDAYRAQYELAALRRATDRLFAAVDLLLLPTAGTVYEIAEVAAEPLRCNANLGLYTNFVNLLDFAAVALPGGFGKSGLPFGFSLIAPAYADRALLDLGTRCQRVAGLPPAARQSSTMAWPAGTTATTSG